MIHDAEDGAACSGLGVRRPVHEARDAGVEDCPGAHGARFERDIEGAAFVVLVEQTIVFQRAACVAEGDHLGVRGGVVIAKNAVLATRDDLAAVNDYRADGDFAVALGGAGFVDGGAEVGEVVSAGRVRIQWIQSGMYDVVHV